MAYDRIYPGQVLGPPHSFYLQSWKLMHLPPARNISNKIAVLERV